MAPVLEAIDKRLDAVEGSITLWVFFFLLIPTLELVQNEDRFTSVREALRSVNKLDLDKLICMVRCLQLG